MKGLPFYLTCFLFAASICYSQPHWTPIGNVDFRACQQFGEGRICIATSGGYLLWSSDDGRAWTPQVLDTASGLNSISFLTPLIGYAGADSGRVYKTLDGGKTWECNAVPTTQSLWNVIALSKDTLLACGAGGLIERSIDGGATWNTISIGEHHRLRKFYFQGRRHGYVIGDSMAFYETTDGGSNWSSMTLPYNPGWYDFIGSMDVSPSGDIALGLDSFVAISTDRGATWNKYVVDNQVTDPSFIKYLNDSVIISLHRNFFLEFSTNRGHNWNSARLTSIGYVFVPQYFHDCWPRQNGNLVLCGPQGTIYELQVPLRPDSTGGLLQQYGNSSSPQSGIIARAGGNSRSLRSLASTLDISLNGGYTWHNRDDITHSNAIYIGIDFDSDSTGVLLTSSSSSYSASYTTNNGATWSYLPNDQWIKHRWVRTDTGSDGTLFLSGDGLVASSTDKGYHWSLWDSCAVVKNKTTSFAVGGSFWGQDSAYLHIKNASDSLPGHTLFRTYDHGKTWEHRAIPGDPMNNCRTWFIDPNLGIGADVGGVVLRTTNAGATWDSLQVGFTTGLFSAIAFNKRGSLGIVAGHNSELYETFDSGKTWIRDFPKPFCVSGQKNLTGVYFIDDTTAIVEYPTSLYRRTFSSNSQNEVVIGRILEQHNKENLFPNPATSFVTISRSLSHVVIFDPLGHSYRVPNHDGTLDISSLPPGVYYVSDGTHRARFVKE
ncbi:MAG: YCF48-related protein [Bacteroidota bacterium]|nr:YCF48-related protein [Bacteroidota bacterium]MDP4233086.1 YCF48-related protein [Bacteroidota bacterium]MDP4241769.1 YCF48-related protein [Bacteroidota bacterium]MDP4287427.1 YCF48-related protein [Bacteroidota bacterium]